ncbi:MAG TPA: hypothetical protein VFI27_02620 [candidate division Zixibacteria bacterium]|nr:hypothetical protein [candidate division Zixibacteria bacterium]
MYPLRKTNPLLVITSLLFIASILPSCNPSPRPTSPADPTTPSDSIASSQTQNETRTTSPAGPIECPEQPAEFVTDLNIRQTPSLAEPDPRVPFHDPQFGTCLVRVTDRHQDISPDDASLGLKNEYSRVQSFNADSSKFIIRGTDATWYLYDALSLRPLAELFLDVDPRWDSSDPDLLYFSEETRLMAYDLQTNQTSTIHEFAADFPGQTLSYVWSRYEGSPSFDGRYWGFMAQDDDWQTIAFLIYDMVEDKVIAARDIPGNPDIDSVTISPFGVYFLAYFDFCEQGQMGSDLHPCGLMVYDRRTGLGQLENGRGLLRIVGHSDTALDAQGREVLVYQDIDTDHISLLDLESGSVTPLLPIDFSHAPIGVHFSGRARNVPGWALISTYSGGHPTDQTWMDDSIFALQLEAGGVIMRLAHTHSLVDEDQEHDYWAEPQASVSADFRRVLFTSNWGRSGTGAVDTYMIQLPQNWLALTPEIP